jgi:hypothetical protein
MTPSWSTRRRPITAAFLSCIAIGGAACSDSVLPGPLPSAPDVATDGSLTVVSPPAAIRRDGGVYRADIPYQYVNRRAGPVAGLGCFPPHPPRLEWWTGDTWAFAYPAIYLGCLSPPYVIAPGATFRDTLHVFVFIDSIGPEGHAQSPSWSGPRSSADYRLVWDICDYRTPAIDPPYDCPPLPLETRVTAPFRMSIAVR